MNVAALQQSVRRILQSRSRSISEYELIKEVAELGLLDACSRRPPAVALFQKHFLIMHVLYRLQDEFALLGKILHIDPLSIEVHDRRDPTASDVASSSVAPLRRYYLDLDNFYESGEEDILELLAGFWRRYEAWESVDDAYAILGLDPNAVWSEIQSAYRRQIKQAHPDKGGDATRFREVFEAYQALKLRIKPP